MSKVDETQFPDKYAEVRDAKTRYENSKELLERAQRVYDRDLNDYVFAMDRAKLASTATDKAQQ